MVLLTGPDQHRANIKIKNTTGTQTWSPLLLAGLFTAQNKNLNLTSTPPPSGAFCVSTPEIN